MNTNTPKRPGKKQKWYIILYILFAMVFLYALYQIGRYYLDYQKAKQEAEDLAEQVIVWEPQNKENNTTKKQDTDEKKGLPEQGKELVVPETIDFDKLWEENKEIAAWLYCPDTVINYPVVHTADNDKYLRKNLALEYSNEGTLFIETKNHTDFTDWNTIIYGHNMKNGEMFKTITYYEDETYYKEHPVMYLYTPEKRYEIRLVAGCVVNAEESEIYHLGVGESLDDTDTTAQIPHQQEKEALLKQLLKKSTFTSEENVTAADRLITLSTCSYEYEDARYILVGKLVQW